MLGKLDNEQIESLLKHNIIGRLGFCENGKSYVLPISYAYDGKYIYCHSFEGRKLEVMRKFPQVCFQVDKMANMANWESLLVWGKFEEIKDPEERKAALSILLDRILPVISSETVHLSPDWPFPPRDINKIEGIVFRIKVDEKSGRFEKAESIYLAAFG